MKKLTRSEYFKLNVIQKALYNILLFLCAIPTTAAKIAVVAGKGIKGLCIKFKDNIVDLFVTFKKGSWQTRVSYLIMGFGNITRGQILRGLLFFGIEVLFFVFMFGPGKVSAVDGRMQNGAYWIEMFSTLGTVDPGQKLDPILDVLVWVPGHNSFDILLYGVLTLVACIAFIAIWRMNITQQKEIDLALAKGKKLATAKDDIRNLLDHQFHKTLLSVPVLGIVCFTVLPIIFMIFVAFTNYGGEFDGYANLFHWVGLENFKELFGISSSGSNLSHAFVEILKWTLTWALFATFTNYFLGMLVAILINKKGIKFKKLWRGILVLTIAIPQFVSLLYVSKLFARSGLVNGMLMKWGLISQPIEFWANSDIARPLVILINIWIGIPYLMLMATGILMNIPADLYESSKIDGANAYQQFTKITLPYMLFVTGPYLLTSFIGNINNFNVIFLLTSGQASGNSDLTVTMPGASVGATDLDLLITWMFNITTGVTSNYKLAAVLAIMIFVVVATLSVIVYNVMPSNRNEEDFQ